MHVAWSRGALSKLLKNVIGLKHAPKILNDINDEVLSLRILASEVDELLRAANQQARGHPIQSLTHNLERVKSIALELESYIAYELTKTPTNEANARVDKSVFLRAESHLQRFKYDICSSRMALGSALSLFTASIILQIHKHIRENPCQLEVSQDNSAIEFAPNLLVRRIPQSGRHFSKPLQTVPETSLAREQRSSLKLETVCEEQLNSIQKVERLEAWEPGFQVQAPKAPVPDVFDDRAGKLQLLRKPSNFNCLCSNQHYYQRSPDNFSAMLGLFSLSYRVFPSKKQPLQHMQCQACSNNITMTYIFPRWLLARSVLVTYSCSMARAPELLLRVMRVRDFQPITDVFLILLEGRSERQVTEGLKNMLDNGEASVLDVNSEGSTILHTAVDLSLWHMALMLISYGADINYFNSEDPYPSSPFVEAWYTRWHAADMPGDLREKWEEIFWQNNSHLDDLGLSDLHKAYLGFGGYMFDAQPGETVLHWAVQKSDLDAVTKLLTSGADPNKQNLLGNSPLHYAQDAAALKLLLTHKADVKLENAHGASPLHGVTSATKSMIKTMIELGASIEQRTRDGKTPLLEACGRNELDVTQELLACGADVNAKDWKGRTLIFQSILSDGYETLDYVLLHPALDWQMAIKMGSFYALVAVSSCNVQTLRVMEKRWKGKIDIDKKIGDRSVREHAQQRRDHNEFRLKRGFRSPVADAVALYEAFMNMIHTINQRQEQSSDSEDELWEDAREYYTESS
ncbi:uncharacterized protein KY384_006703 [Bacidia gigantensis]|uniref:uncharacterized protein n=1 Tax=Bacidia gigantensis TaxID=2732470 RepID=UPI001D04AE1D|nr:uncharacterized protein KY384_006703 [Bacidia gigantensis]KAG8529014.1 hypothetical protein KY384_006703 [Bacidia gigantensis]